MSAARGLVSACSSLVLVWLGERRLFRAFPTSRPQHRLRQIYRQDRRRRQLNWPYPIGGVIKPQVTNVVTTEVGSARSNRVRTSRQPT